VINLIGREYSTRNFSLDDSNNKLARIIAKISKKNHVERLIHFSALAANHQSPSEWARAKARGEDGVSELFPEATIFRPADIFGSEDNLTNWQGWWINNAKIVPIYKPKRTIQPIYVIDVAKAVLEALNNVKTAGKTYELVGPKQYNMRQFCNTISNILIEHPRTFVMGPVSTLAYRLISDYLIRRPYFNREAIPLRGIDVLPTGVSTGKFGSVSDVIKENLSTIEDVSLPWLRRYRTQPHLNLFEDAEFHAHHDTGTLMIPPIKRY